MRYVLGYILAFGMLVAALILPGPANAAGCFSFDAEVAAKPPGRVLEIVPDENLAGLLSGVRAQTGKEFPGATRAFVVFMSGVTLAGIETYCCLQAPIVIKTGPLLKKPVPA